jgi:hypothetical protein
LLAFDVQHITVENDPDIGAGVDREAVEPFDEGVAFERFGFEPVDDVCQSRANGMLCHFWFVLVHPVEC